MSYLLVGLFLVSSCSGGGGADLTCEYLSDPDNCWAAAAAEAKACLPASAQAGLLAADRSSCSFSDGTVVVFDDPLPDDTEDLERFGFTIERDGAFCASFVDTFENRMELTGSGPTVVSQLHPGSRFEVDCGDGHSYEADFGLLFECAAGTQPTDGFFVAPDEVTFMILSVNTPGQLFRCSP